MKIQSLLNQIQKISIDTDELLMEVEDKEFQELLEDYSKTSFMSLDTPKDKISNDANELIIPYYVYHQSSSGNKKVVRVKRVKDAKKNAREQVSYNK